MATSETYGDDDEWVRQAFQYPDLVAGVLISFRLWCQEADGDERPSTSAPPSVCALEWGTRRKRSRLQIPPVFPVTQEEEEEEEEEKERKILAATAAAEAETEAEEKNRKGNKRRASPQSPLEGYSSASASGGEEGAKTGLSTGVYIAGPGERRNEVVAAAAATNPREPTVACFIRRPPSKKMTKVELQVVQTSLLEEKAKLVKEIEIWRRALEQLRAENGKLKSFRKLPKPPVNNHHATKAVQQLHEECQPVAPSIAPGRKDFIELPDLNDLPTECWSAN